MKSAPNQKDISPAVLLEQVGWSRMTVSGRSTQCQCPKPEVGFRRENRLR